MKSRFFDEDFSISKQFSLRMLNQLQYETSYTSDLEEEAIRIVAIKEDHKVSLLLKQARKGMVKVTIEVDRPIKKIADYEERKRLEISLINSLEAYICASDEFVLGV